MTKSGVIKSKICLHDIVVTVDFKMGQTTMRGIAVYLPYAGYNWKYFMDILNDIEGLVMEAIEAHYSLLITGKL